METHQNIAMAQASEPAGQTALRARDGVELPLYVWRASAPPRAAIALIHGLAEHAGRYAALAAQLNAAGIDVYAVDLRGHGHARGRRTWIAHFDEYLDDAEALLAHANAQCVKQGIPLFLMGHSMGGAIAALYAVERLPQARVPLAGLLLSSAALAPGRDVPAWKIAASRVISAIWPTFPAMKIDAALLARNPKVVEANRADPLVHHGAIPARTGAQLLEAMKRIEAGRAHLRLPVLIWHGAEDKLTEPEGSRAFGANVGSADRTLTLYEGSYHETLNDLDRQRVIDALIDWIGRHC
ncbi:alpha-beta hydrolase superfamily lysophospholipase [Paraburkholderia silvatlantica]|uniref:Alpha-beta hydrolase superfamily lysophospholipase n=1 Tax=Paraburkholderia silvatlantica TaxID=321895 RepID=A0ABR6FTY5_9BURK|nr:alpha/beta hydrolase [Paraburkholderia silvatlantica]MBB2930059.1 alpha-beta hydrolase superfamily lysophospholipase [Paraburkholderia silvatlantica]PVY29744.1 alpha-beta hydrolase superfamily lysophospholipase [Paraburkholderia silvatlantica]PXW31586.1 alpha-beta hydrolase superfamily lysophospholipase [Paraburkholderia silvatlantica]